MEARLKTGLWVAALVRRYDREAIPAVVARRGDPDAGAVLVKVNRRDAGCTVFARERGADDTLAWQPVSGEGIPEAEADAYISRQIGRDPDLWVVEVEDRAARPLFRDMI